MNADYSNGPNGWGRYNAAPVNGNGYDSSDMYESDANESYMNDGQFDDDDNANGAFDAALAQMADIGRQQPINSYMQPIATSNAAYFPAQPVRGVRPPPIEALWDMQAQCWYYPVQQMQQQQFMGQNLLGGPQQQYLPLAPPPNAGQMELGTRLDAGPVVPQPLNNAITKTQPKRKTAKTGSKPRTKKKKGQKIKKPSVAKNCVCQNGIPTHIKRPPNDYILFRKAWTDELKRLHKASKSPMQHSKWIGWYWHNVATQETRDKYEAMAKQVAADHRAAHPGYTYKPLAKNAAKFGTDLCTCGAFEANIAKLEREMLSEPRRITGRGQSRDGRSPEHELNYGLPGASGKRKASVYETQPSPKRTRCSSRSGRTSLTSMFQDAAQFGQMIPYGQQMPMSNPPSAAQGQFSAGLFDDNGNINMNQDPFAEHRSPGFGYQNGFTAPGHFTRSKSVVVNQDPADFEELLVDPSTYMYDVGTPNLPDSYWDVGGDGMSNGGGFDPQQIDREIEIFLNDRTPTQVSPTRRSTRISAQKGSGAGNAISPTTPRRSQRRR